MYTNRNGASTNPNVDSSLLCETFYPARGAHFTNTDTCQCKHNTCTSTSTVAPCSSLEVSPWVQTTHHNTILVAPPAEMELVTPRYPRNSRNEKSQQISSLSIWARVPEIPAGSNHWWASNASSYTFWENPNTRLLYPMGLHLETTWIHSTTKNSSGQWHLSAMLLEPREVPDPIGRKSNSTGNWSDPTGFLQIRSYGHMYTYIYIHIYY